MIGDALWQCERGVPDQAATGSIQFVRWHVHPRPVSIGMHSIGMHVSVMWGCVHWQMTLGIACVVTTFHITRCHQPTSARSGKPAGPTWVSAHARRSVQPGDVMHASHVTYRQMPPCRISAQVRSSRASHPTLQPMLSDAACRRSFRVRQTRLMPASSITVSVAFRSHGRRALQRADQRRSKAFRRHERPCTHELRIPRLSGALSNV